MIPDIYPRNIYVHSRLLFLFTTINYSIAKEGNVKLTVYNSIGSKAATLVNENKPAGDCAAQFNGRKRASGV
jgi:hypothetical protein